MNPIPCLEHRCGDLDPDGRNCRLIARLPASAGELLYERPCRFRILIERAAARFHGQGSYEGRHEEAVARVIEAVIAGRIRPAAPTYRDLRNYLIVAVRNACVVAYRCEHCWYYSRRHCEFTGRAVAPKDRKTACGGEGFAFARERRFPLHPAAEPRTAADPDRALYAGECVEFLRRFDPEAAEILSLLIALVPKKEILERFGGRDASWLSKKIHGRTDVIGGRRVFSPGIRQKVRAFGAELLRVPDEPGAAASELETVRRWSERWNMAAEEFYRRALALCIAVDYRRGARSLAELVRAEPARADLILDLYEAGNAVLYGAT